MLSKLFFLLLLAAPAEPFTLITAGMRGWEHPEVVFRFNPSDCSTAPERIEAAVYRAIDLWNSVPTSRLRVRYGGRTSETGESHLPIISCTPAGISGSVAVSTLVVLRGYISTGMIQLNSEPGDSANIAERTDAQLQVALAHEMGHIFGLGHSREESALMYFTLGRKENLKLSQDDMDGLTWLYPRKEPEHGLLGCGSLGGGAGGGGLLWVLGLAAALHLMLSGFSSKPRARRKRCSSAPAPSAEEQACPGGRRLGELHPRAGAGSPPSSWRGRSGSSPG
jgi:hypothetical protein